MQNLQDELINLLSKDDRFTKDGKLLKNNIIEAALKLDSTLLKILLTHKSIKKHFFQEVEGVLVFDKIEFQKFVSNKAFLKDSYTAYSNKIGLTVDDEFITEGKQVVLCWPYKDCVLEGGQTKEDEKRDEIFWNETLAPDEIDRLLSPKVLTNFKKYDSKGEHNSSVILSEAKDLKDYFLNQNLIIKGNNLLALHSLLPIYAGKIKLIYIDPPFNTGGSAESFTYNNYFKHSTWLTFIKNRMMIAKSFLREDGFIAIAIDHNELFYLGSLADEIFGRENRLGIITVVHKPEGRQFANFFSASNEFMIVYAKNKELANFESVILDKEKEDVFDQEDEKGNFKAKNFIRLTDGKYSLRINKPDGYYPIYVSKDLQNFSLTPKNNYEATYPITDKGVERVWKTSGKTFMEKVQNGEIFAKRENKRIVLYEKLRVSQVYTTHWVNKKYHSYHFGTKLLEKILGTKAFSFPKSINTIIDILKLTTRENDLVLDFFAGSGTTAHAVLELNKEDGGNRKFILCEQMEYIESVTKERIKKVIANNKVGSFNYCALAELNFQFVNQINTATTTIELKQIWETIKKDGFISYKINPKEIDESIKEFEELSLKDQKKFLMAVLDKNHLYVNYSEIEDKDYKISEEDKKLNKKFYSQK